MSILYVALGLLRGNLNLSPSFTRSVVSTGSGGVSVFYDFCRNDWSWLFAIPVDDLLEDETVSSSDIPDPD
jgi:hypothetical protein